jgi:hypothetical protein
MAIQLGYLSINNIVWRSFLDLGDILYEGYIGAHKRTSGKEDAAYH